MEVCVDNIQSVKNAIEGGAGRLELCSSLNVGGLTPTVGLLIVSRRFTPKHCQIFVMIRPRAGNDFCYSEEEIAVMLEDIRIFKENGADGFVFGCLDEGQCIDTKSCKQLLEQAHPLPCTFHRAFDVVKNPFDSLVKIGDLGFRRILTSGQEKSADKGKKMIKEMIDFCSRQKLKLIIMPGGGINKCNLAEVLEHTHAPEFHGSGKTTTSYSNTIITDEKTVRELIQIGKKFGCSIVES